jgi:hypothetical protein
MGADLWHHETLWHKNPEAALQALQAQFVAENYHLATLLPQQLTWARESVEACQADGDPYGLLEMMQRNVEQLEQLCNQPIPTDAAGQIEIVRQLNADSGQGIGNVLDITRVTKQRKMHTAQQLPEKEIVRLVGAAKPDRAQAQKSIYKISGELDRGECVCFAVYEAGEPVGWFFVGNTID